MAPPSSAAQSPDLGQEFAAAAGELLAARLPVEPHASPEALIGRQNAIWPELTELGWFDLLRPEDEDGLGLEPAVLGGMFAAIGRNLAPGPLIASMFAAPWLASRFGDAALGTGPAGQGTRFALADPARGGWLASGERLRLSGGRLEGTVRGVPNLPDAERIIVCAGRRAEDRVLLAIDPEAEGVRIEPSRTLDPSWSFGTLVCDGCRVGEPELVARGAEAGRALAEVLAWERILLSCEISGAVDRVLELTVAFVKERSQFGRPIGSFQAVKHMVADMACAAITLRNLISLTLEEAGAASPQELEEAAMALKSHASKVGVGVCEAALQSHGGIGFTSEYELHLYFKRALTVAAQLGSARELDVELGARALDRGRRREAGSRWS
ncbi:MAG TPA: acyl-CoA dehydrogenase family protein [Solirubrobacterales bacterium]|jgi:alkylation response protein AidB-like acyl-CoA dehydrogenase